MTENMKTFKRWFKDPLEQLYKNNDAGFIVMIVSLPLLERFLREKSGEHEKTSLGDPFYQEFIRAFRSVRDVPDAKIVWELIRHGLLHQATLKIATKKGAVIHTIGVHNSVNEIEVNRNSQGRLAVMVSPIKFSRRVIALIEGDFHTFESAGSPSHPPADVDPTSGISGFKGP